MGNMIQLLSCCRENEKITIKVKSNCFGKPLIIKIDNDDDHEEIKELKEMINKLIEKKKDNVIKL